MSLRIESLEGASAPVAARPAEDPDQGSCDEDSGHGDRHKLGLRSSADDAPQDEQGQRICGQVLQRAVQEGCPENCRQACHAPRDNAAGAEMAAPEQVVGEESQPALWMIVRGDVKVLVNNPSLSRAGVLDPNGMPVRDLPVETTAGRNSFQFPPDALDAVLE